LAVHINLLDLWLGLFRGLRLRPNRASPPASQRAEKMSIEQLMDIEVTSVSKRPERLSEMTSAIQVITQDLPAKVSRQWFSAFGQDEIAIEEADWTGIADGEK
jgi:hypothetical protein